MNTRLASALSLAAALLLGSAALADGQGQIQPRAVAGEQARAAASAANMTPQQFARQVAAGGLAEIRLSELARQKSGNAEVREFAARMIADHRNANAQLQAIARRKGLKLPAQLDAVHEEMLQELQSKQGPAFDAAYLAAMKKDHVTTIGLLQVANGPTFEDPELKVFASTTLPVVEQHHKQAEALETRTTQAATQR
jgi:putative membrane protein